MKKHLFLFSLLAVAVLSACNKTLKDPEPVAVGLQLVCDGDNFAVADLTVSLQDADASFTLESKTDASGKASFLVNRASTAPLAPMSPVKTASAWPIPATPIRSPYWRKLPPPSTSPSKR